MLAKVITWGADRQESIRKMVRALQDTVILGVTTNIPFLVDILRHPEFIRGNSSTKFITDYMEPWSPSTDTTNSTWLALAAYEAIREGQCVGSSSGIDQSGSSTLDPWRKSDGWRNVSSE